MKKILLISIFIVTIYAFVTNRDYKNIIQSAYVNSIGFDYNEETEEFTLYYFILNSYNLGQTGKNASSPEILSYVAKASDKYINLAEKKIRQNSNIIFEFSHIRSIIINERFFTNDNILQLIAYFREDTNFSSSFQVYTTSSEIDKIFEIDNFAEISGYYTTQHNLYVDSPTYNDLCNDVFDENYTISYTSIKTNEGIFFDSEKPYVSSETVGKSFITSNYQLTTFSYENFYGLTYFNKLNNKSIQIKYGDEFHEEDFFVLINGFKLSTKVKNDKLKITISIDGNIMDDMNYLSNEEIKQYIEEYIKKGITTTIDTLYNYDIDFFNITYRYRHKYNYKDLPLEFKFKIAITN